MPKGIKQIRTSFDAKLDALQAKAEAFDANLTQSKQKVTERVEQRKQALHDALDRFKAEIQRQEDLAAEKKQKLAAEIDEIKVQIALGKAETRDALETQRKKIGDAIAKLESAADKALEQMEHKADASWETMIHHYVSARDALDAELEAAAIRMTSTGERVGAVLERE
jgi:DNA repair exonuclease SbcCD ATPase subunit